MESVHLQEGNSYMVSIQHGTILHGSDSARPIGHGPIVHENNRAPYQLDTARFSTDLIVHVSVMQKRLGTGSIVHKSVMQKRFGTGSIVHETTIQERFSTGSIVHESVLQKRFATGTVYVKTIQHQLDCAPLQLCTSEYKKNCLIKSHFFLTLRAQSSQC